MPLTWIVVGPSAQEVMYAAWHPDEAPSIDNLTAGRVELVAHTGAELSAEDRYVFISRMPVRWDLIAVGHL
jgi:hypothetical protein